MIAFDEKATEATSSIKMPMKPAEAVFETA